MKSIAVDQLDNMRSWANIGSMDVDARIRLKKLVWNAWTGRHGYFHARSRERIRLEFELYKRNAELNYLT